jgi:prepilin-type N-terminal cleavage/methylation domain-containing protein
MKNKQKGSNSGFSMVELLVVVAIIALLSSVSLVAYQQARQKARNTKRVSEMVQIIKVLEIYNLTNKGYPSGLNGVPQNLTSMAATIPVSPNPPDGICNTPHTAGEAYNGVNYFCVERDPNCAGVPWNQYYYTASGTPLTISPGVNVYPDYVYYFCIGQQTGDIGPGPKAISPNNKDINLR